VAPPRPADRNDVRLSSRLRLRRVAAIMESNGLRPEGDEMPQTSEKGHTLGQVMVFWAWIAVLAGGLAYMIVIPLIGR